MRHKIKFSSVTTVVHLEYATESKYGAPLTTCFPSSACKDLLFVCIRNSLIDLYLVLSTPHDVGKQGTRNNNLIKAMNVIMSFQSTTSYEGFNTMVNA
jgi:hypothetical protein